MSRRSSGEGSVVQRSDGRWAATFQVGGKRFWAYGKTRKEAADKLQELRQQEAQGLLVEPSRITVAQLLSQWLEAARVTCKPVTVHGYEEVARCHLIPAVGNVKLQRLAPQHLVKLYQQKRSQGLSPRRVAIIHATIHRALAEAVRWRVVSINIADNVTPPREEQAEKEVWTADEVRRFVVTAQSSDDPYAPPLLLALSLGLRVSELEGLTWDYVDQEAGKITIARSLVWVGGTPTWGSPKSRAGLRVLPLTPTARIAVSVLRHQQNEARLKAGAAWKNADCRIVTTSTGGVPTSNTLKRSLERLCEKAGVRRLTVHGLRHQCASLLLASNIDVKQVQRYMGHSRASVTLDTYAHLIGSGQAETAYQMEKALSGSHAV